MRRHLRRTCCCAASVTEHSIAISTPRIKLPRDGRQRADAGVFRNVGVSDQIVQISVAQPIARRVGISETFS